MPWYLGWGTAFLAALQEDILFTVVPVVVLLVTIRVLDMVQAPPGDTAVTSLTPEMLFATIVLGGIAVSRLRASDNHDDRTQSAATGRAGIDAVIHVESMRAKELLKSRLLLLFYLLCIVVLSIGILYSRGVFKPPPATPSSAADPKLTLWKMAALLLGASSILVIWTQRRILQQKIGASGQGDNMSERIENLTKDAKRLRSELNQFQKAVRQLQPDQTEEGECEDILESLTGEVRNLTGQCSKVISALKI